MLGSAMAVADNWGVSTSQTPRSAKKRLTQASSSARCRSCSMRAAGRQADSKAGLFLDAGNVFAAAGVDLEQFALFDEERHAHYRTRLQGRRLTAAAAGIA